MALGKLFWHCCALWIRSRGQEIHGRLIRQSREVEWVLGQLKWSIDYMAGKQERGQWV